MSSRAKFSLISRENQSRSLQRIKRPLQCFWCAQPSAGARKLKYQVNKTRTKKPRKDEEERDFFCIVSDAFRVFARRSARILGSACAFGGAVLVIAIWLITGPTFHFSDTWQLIINTATTIITFLMVFLIQNTQNRDAKAVHLKLDETIRALKGARNQLVDLEDLSDEELKKLEEQFQRLRKKAEHDGTHSHKVNSAKSR